MATHESALTDGPAMVMIILGINEKKIKICKNKETLNKDWSWLEFAVQVRRLSIPQTY